MAAPTDEPASPPALTVRPAGPGDRAALVALAREAFGSEHQALSTRGVFDVSALPAFVAERGSVVGFAVWVVEGDELEVLALACSPPGTGAGRALMERVHAHGVDLGCRAVRLVTTDDNVGAQGFYEHLGFERAGVRVGAVDECRRRYKPEIPPGIHDEIEYRRPV